MSAEENNKPYLFLGIRVFLISVELLILNLFLSVFPITGYPGVYQFLSGFLAGRDARDIQEGGIAIIFVSTLFTFVLRDMLQYPILSKQTTIEFLPVIYFCLTASNISVGLTLAVYRKNTKQNTENAN